MLALKLKEMMNGLTGKNMLFNSTFLESLTEDEYRLLYIVLHDQKVNKFELKTAKAIPLLNHFMRHSGLSEEGAVLRESIIKKFTASMQPIDIEFTVISPVTLIDNIG